MIKVAITGNIASGKSAVQSVLIDLGYKVLDTDEVSHRLLTVSNPDLYSMFKNYDVFENGEFSREKLGKLVFYDTVLKRALESVLYPQIEDCIKEFYSLNNREEVVFIAIPLLFEAGMEHLFDKILFVYANDDIRLERLIKRNSYDTEYAKLRMSSQISQEQKIEKSDYIIRNNDTIDKLSYEVKRVLKFLRV